MKRIAFLFAVIAGLLVGCSDNSTDPVNQSGKGMLKVYLVDAPASLDSVIIFVERVEVHKAGSDSTAGWFVINDSLRSFNLLDLVNGASAVLGDSVLDAGQYTQIRLILADGNYVIDNGVKHDLTVPSGFQTGIKLNHQFTIMPNTLYELLLDFNVDKSIHVTGNGKYMMKPVIRVCPLITSGAISGLVLPLDANATVFTTIGMDTVTTYPDTAGYFKLMGLPEGAYDVSVLPANVTYKDTVITGVNVLANQVTDLDTIELQLN